MAKVKWGIIAPGRIAHKFAEDFKRVNNAELLGVGSRSLVRARKFAKRFNIERYYGSYRELVEDKDIDIVYIATPHNLHQENTLMALNSGKGVLCEKPFAINSKEVKRMVSTAKKNRLFLMEAMWARFNPALVKLRELLKKNIIGDIQFLRANFSFKARFNPKNRLFNPYLGGGALLDIGVYCVALTQMIFGFPDDIKSFCVKGKTNVDEHNAITLFYKKGKIAQISSSFRYNGDNEAFIVGSKGSIKLFNHWYRSLKIEVNTKNKKRIINFTNNDFGLNYQVEHINKLFLSGKIESNIMSLSDSLEIMKIMDTIRKQWKLVYPMDLD